MDLPWWTASPSPFSLVWYCLYGYYSHRKGLSWREAAWFTGFVVLSGDLMWCLASGLRFGPWNIEALPQLIICIGRDIAAMLLFYSLLGMGSDPFKKAVKFPRDLYLMNGMYLLIWFLSAANPSYTDWTYAWQYDVGGLPRILYAFFVSHIIGRLILLRVLDGWFTESFDFRNVATSTTTINRRTTDKICR